MKQSDNFVSRNDLVSKIESILIYKFKDRCNLRFNCVEYQDFFRFIINIDCKIRIKYEIDKSYVFLNNCTSETDVINILEESGYRIEKFLQDDFYYFLEDFNRG